MPIQVATTDGHDNTHPEAKSWHVDDHGYLHIIKSRGGNVATYAPSAWLSVVENEEN